LEFSDHRSIGLSEWERLGEIPILDGLEWELSFLMDHPELGGVLKESVSGVVRHMTTEDDPSEC
jgi:hypothetical protein